MSEPTNLQEFYAQLDEQEEATQVVADQPTVVQEQKTPHEPMVVAPLPREDEVEPAEEAAPPPPVVPQPSIQIDFSRFVDQDQSRAKQSEVNVPPPASWLWNGGPTNIAIALGGMMGLIVLLVFVSFWWLLPAISDSAAEGQLATVTPIGQTAETENPQTEVVTPTPAPTGEEVTATDGECASPVPEAYYTLGTDLNYTVPEGMLPENRCYNTAVLKQGGKTKIGVWGGSENWCQELTEGGQLPKTYWHHDFSCDLHISGSFVFPPGARVSITTTDGTECVAVNNEIGPHDGGRWADYPLLITPAVAACLGSADATEFTEVHLKMLE